MVQKNTGSLISFSFTISMPNSYQYDLSLLWFIMTKIRSSCLHLYFAHDNISSIEHIKDNKYFWRIRGNKLEEERSNAQINFCGNLLCQEQGSMAFTVKCIKCTDFILHTIRICLVMLIIYIYLQHHPVNNF